MARAVVPKSERKTGRRKKPLAAASAGHYTIYVNPNATERADPEQLQARAFEILEAWHEDGLLKEQLLKAVLHYVGKPTQSEDKQLEQKELIDAISRRMEKLLKGLPFGREVISHSVLQEELEEIQEDIQDFGETYLSFGDD